MQKLNQCFPRELAIIFYVYHGSIHFTPGSFQPGHHLCKCPSLPPAPIQWASLSPRLLPPSCPTPSPPSGPYAKNRQHSSCHSASCPSLCPHHTTPPKPLCCPAHPMPRGSSSSLFKGFTLLGVDTEPAELEGISAKATGNHQGEPSPAPCHVQDVPCSAQNILCWPSMQEVGSVAFLSPVQTPPASGQTNGQAPVLPFWVMARRIWPRPLRPLPQLSWACYRDRCSQEPQLICPSPT